LHLAPSSQEMDRVYPGTAGTKLVYPGTAGTKLGSGRLLCHLVKKLTRLGLFRFLKKLGFGSE